MIYHLNRLNEAILMITHKKPLEDEIRQTCLDNIRFIYIWKNGIGLSERVTKGEN